MFPTLARSDTGYTALNIPLNLLYGANNLATIPFNAISQSMARVERGLKGVVGFSDVEVEGLRVWWMVEGPGAIKALSDAMPLLTSTLGSVTAHGGEGLRRYNFGGEGEKAGMTDVNAMIGNRLSETQIRAANPTGDFIQADIAEFLENAKSGSAKEILANRIPSMAIGRKASSIALNMKRVLAPGGTARFSVSSQLSPGDYKAFEEVGFVCESNGCRFTKE
jgi:hypothetical protein